MTGQADVSRLERIVERLPRDRSAFTADELEGRPIPPRVWQYEGLIPGRTVTLLTGDGGVGKSKLAIQACCSTVLGLPWIGQDPRRGNALYLSAEDERDELHRRINDIATFYGAPLSNLTGLKVWPLADGDAVLATSQGDRIGATPLWETLEQMALEWEPRLIAIDASADAFAVNENDRNHVRQAVGLLRGLAIRADAAVVLLSHPSLAGLASGSGFSGSTAWNNSVRSRLYLSRPKDDDGGASATNIRTLAVKKANYAASGGELRLRLKGGAFTNDDAQPGGIDRQVANDRVDRSFLELLAAFEGQGRIVSDRAGRNYAPTLFAQDPRAQGTTSKGYAAAMGRLFADSTIKIIEEGPASRRRYRIAKADA